MFRPLLLLGSTLALTLTGCDELTCTTEARASVQLSVVDSAGSAISSASAEYTIEGEDWPEPQPCEDMGGGALVCGWEVDDVFHIEVSAPGYGSEMVEVEVFADECHVITEQVTVELEAA